LITNQIVLSGFKDPREKNSGNKCDSESQKELQALKLIW